VYDAAKFAIEALEADSGSSEKATGACEAIGVSLA
jgi:hypothetical protein